MRDEDAGALFGAILLEALFVYSWIWWSYVRMALVIVACVLACIPSRVGGTVVVYEREPDEVDELAATLRRIERAQTRTDVPGSPRAATGAELWRVQQWRPIPNRASYLWI